VRRGRNVAVRILAEFRSSSVIVVSLADAVYESYRSGAKMTGGPEGVGDGSP